MGRSDEVKSRTTSSAQYCARPLNASYTISSRNPTTLENAVRRSLQHVLPTAYWPMFQGLTTALRGIRCFFLSKRAPNDYVVPTAHVDLVLRFTRSSSTRQNPYMTSVAYPELPPSQKQTIMLRTSRITTTNIVMLVNNVVLGTPFHRNERK